MCRSTRSGRSPQRAQAPTGSGNTASRQARAACPLRANGVCLRRLRMLERQREDDLNRFEAAVRRCPDIQDCYLMTGSSDYLLK
ncbi:Lrp/AsnC ligand binding domain-containing protein, partial [Methylobacterium brachiatum]